MTYSSISAALRRNKLHNIISINYLYYFFINYKLNLYITCLHCQQLTPFICALSDFFFGDLSNIYSFTGNLKKYINLIYFTKCFAFLCIQYLHIKTIHKSPSYRFSFRYIFFQFIYITRRLFLQ